MTSHIFEFEFGLAQEPRTGASRRSLLQKPPQKPPAEASAETPAEAPAEAGAKEFNNEKNSNIN